MKTDSELFIGLGLEKDVNFVKPWCVMCWLKNTSSQIITIIRTKNSNFINIIIRVHNPNFVTISWKSVGDMFKVFRWNCDGLLVGCLHHIGDKLKVLWWYVESFGGRCKVCWWCLAGLLAISWKFLGDSANVFYTESLSLWYVESLSVVYWKSSSDNPDRCLSIWFSGGQS